MTTFLGLGEMGGALASAALDAGHHTVVWNRSPDRTTAFSGRAEIADTVEAAVAGAGVIVACLFDRTSVHDVLDPVAGGLSGRTLINLTTTTPNQSRDLATWAAGHGITYLDGAIMAVPDLIGGPHAAVQGVDPRVLRPVHDLVRRQIDAGYGTHGTARMYEELRSTR